MNNTKRLTVSEKFMIKTLVGLFPLSSNDLLFIKTQPNGNCFFECVSKCFDFSESSKNPITILREIVVKEISDYSINTAKIINNWRELWNMGKIHRNPQLLQEFQQVRDIEYIPLNQSLNTDDLDKINQVIMTRAFWAEEFSIKNISKALDVCFIVIDEAVGKIQNPIYKTLTAKTTYIIVYLDRACHYSLIVYRQLSRMVWNDLPPEIKNELQRNEEFINKKCSA